MIVNDVIRIYNEKHDQDKVEFAAEPGLMVIKPSGPLDQDSSADLMALLETAVDSLGGGDRLIVDMSSINYISSTGVGSLSQALVRAEKRGISFVLRAIPPKIRSVIQLLGLLPYFKEE
jgi:anti-sigma B factor antagonist